MKLNYKIKFLSKKYNYPIWMIERYFEILGEETTNFLEACEKPLLKSIRINTIKTDKNQLIKKLESKNFKLKEIDWINNGYWIIESPYSIGATEEYLEGDYFIQTSASMLPPIVLNPQVNDIVLDMCAAPGGKTSHLAQIMNNKGIIISIEINSNRIISLKNNLTRCLVGNTIILNIDANDFNNYNYKVDKILLDAPCTGEGLIRDKPERKSSRKIDDIIFCSNNQKQLISTGIKCLKKGGELVYSTCSLSPEENEEIIDFALKNYPVETEPINIIGDEGIQFFQSKRYDSRVTNAKRIYPHKYDSIGFFICKLVKKED